MDVYLEANLSVIQPDLLVLLNEHLKYIKADGVYGAPDMVIEVLSPTNRLHDTQKKKGLYEKAGVKEFFIVDPGTKEVTFFNLNSSGVYQQEYQQKGIVNSPLIGCLIEF